MLFPFSDLPAAADPAWCIHTGNTLSSQGLREGGGRVTASQDLDGGHRHNKRRNGAELVNTKGPQVPVGQAPQVAHALLIAFFGFKSHPQL